MVGCHHSREIVQRDFLHQGWKGRICNNNTKPQPQTMPSTKDPMTQGTTVFLQKGVKLSSSEHDRIFSFSNDYARSN